MRGYIVIVCTPCMLIIGKKTKSEVKGLEFKAFLLNQTSAFE